MKKSMILVIIAVFVTVAKPHGLAVHVNSIESLKAYYLDKYGAEDPYYKLMVNYPEYFLYGTILPDIQYIHFMKPVLEDLYDEINSKFAMSVSYEVIMTEVPDKETTTFSLGFNTHDYTYAFQFAQYLLDQAILLDPPGANPGGTGLSALARQHKLALAAGYYAHLVQDIISHNFWVPKHNAKNELGEFNLILDDEGLEAIPGIQSHNIVEAVHDYRLGPDAAAAVANLVYDDIYVNTYQLEPSVPLVLYPSVDGSPPVEHHGLNPALDFFYEVLEDFYNNQLPAEHRTNALISKLGFEQEATLFRFGNRFFPAMAGHQSFPDVLAEWIANHTDLNDAAEVFIGITPIYLIANALLPQIQGDLQTFVHDEAYKKAEPKIVGSLPSASMTFLGTMLNDMQLADQLAAEYPDLVNATAYAELKTKSIFTDPNYFSDWSYYQGIENRYFDEVGPGGKIYADWAPVSFHTFSWGVMNALNESTPTLQRRLDIGVYDAYFTVDGVRYDENTVIDGPGHNFEAVAELYAFEDMTSQLLPVHPTAQT